MRVSLCGRVMVEGPGPRAVVVGRPQVQLCLAVLVLERHRAVTRDELAHTLWGDEPGGHWRGALRGVLSKVRDSFAAAGFPDDVLVTAPGMVQLVLPDDVEVDTEVARRLTAAAEAAMATGEATSAAGSAASATALLDGGFLVAVDRPWADARREEVARQRRLAMRLEARALIGIDPSAAVAPLERVLSDDPFDDDSLALLLGALTAAGERAAAMAAYQRHVALLRDELGVAPSSSLREVGERVLGSAPLDHLRVPGSSDEASADHGSALEAGEDAPVERRAAPRPAGSHAASEPFVGRDGEVGVLRGAIDRASGSAGITVVVLEGEPGVGKTRLARVTAAAVVADGGRVLWGPCSAHGEIPFEPVAVALERELSARPEERVLVADLDAALAPLLPSSTGSPGGASIDRTRVFAGAREAFRRLADRPLLWVVDDLQWATADTLALVEHVAVGLGDRPVVLLATCRERGPSVAAMLELLGRHGSLEVVRLAGLSEAAVDEWLGELDVPSRGGLAADVRDRTGGNPLFVGHLIRASRTAGGVLDPRSVPPALATLLAQRIDALTRDQDLVLGAVAVAGDFATMALVGDMTGLTAPDLLDAVDRLAVAGLLEESGDRLRFGHDLVRDAVLDHLGAARRSWLHLRAASSLESRPRRRGGAAELARHHAAAGPEQAGEARRWALVAADEALDQVAWVTAAELAATVLSEPASDPDERAGALVVLGRARRGMGDATGAAAVLDEAVALARLHGLQRRLGQAALAVVGGGGRGIADPARHRWVPLLEEALAGLADDGSDDRLRVPLLGALAVALLLTDRHDERRAVGREALRLARDLGDRALLARALLDHRYCLSPVELDERIAELDEALDLAASAGLPEVTSAGLVYRYEDSLLGGLRVEADAVMAEAAAHLAEHADPYWSWALASWRVVELLLDGRLDDAEEAAGQAAAMAPDSAVGVACYGVNLVAVRAYQGRVGEMVDMLRQAADDSPFIPCYRAVLAFALAETGQLDAAAVELHHFSADGFASVSHDTNRFLTLAMLAEVVVRLDDVAAASDLWPLLEPYAGRYVVLNCYGGGGTVWGPASALLAGLALVRGDRAAAGAWTDRALEEVERVGDRAFAPRLGVTRA